MLCCLYLLYKLPQSVFLNDCYMPKFKQIKDFVVKSPQLSNKLILLLTAETLLNCKHYPFSFSKIISGKRQAKRKMLFISTKQTTQCGSWHFSIDKQKLKY